ncbi:MAG: serine protease [Thermoguttaceae bacterium]|jgi:hypothetical protein
MFTFRPCGSVFAILILSLFPIPEACPSESPAISSSRKSCAQISTENGHGTGFFIGTQHVATCLHVVARWPWSFDTYTIEITCIPFKNIQVKTYYGEIIDAELVSIPQTTVRSNDTLIVPPQQDTTNISAPASVPVDLSKLSPPTYFPWHSVQTGQGLAITVARFYIPMPDCLPFAYDFAILKLKTAPKIPPAILSIDKDDTPPDVGMNALFSGYPLDAPAMLTHIATISGIANGADLICLEAPVNKGNSGGALISTNAQVIGILDLREGGLSQGLAMLKEQLAASRPSSRMFLMQGGVMLDPIDTIKELIDTLDEYISPGIGYAVSTKHLRVYLDKYPDDMK